MALFLDLLKVLVGIIIGFIIGFLVARKFMQKQLKENPPINEKMIKAMMTGMGRTPSQKQINQMMKSMQKYM
ncbi:MAG: YneF family protein [Bacilli bacterium]|nr:YneF family protein [Bacilli bacterium]